MNKVIKLVVVIVVLAVLIVGYNCYYLNKESFKSSTQNYVYTNYNDIADNLEYGSKQPKQIFQEPAPTVYGPSTIHGVNKNSNVDNFDERGYKWTKNAKDPKVDVFTDVVDDIQLRNRFERTYMLDPDGSLAMYDISNNKISPNCCPAQYAPPFKLTDKNESNCDYAQKYVANNYSGMNYKDGYGCVCMTPKQAEYYGNRGGNTD